MTSIRSEAAIEALWQALEWAPIELSNLFDQIASRLHRNPRFRDMTVAEIDALLADARRASEHDLGELEWRLVQTFKDAIAHLTRPMG
jgi:hypothetical protein